MVKFKTFMKELLVIIKKQEMQILPGEIAFFLFLSIVPLITLMGFVFSQFSLSIESLVNFMNETLPKDVSSILVPVISGKGIDANVITFMIIGFFLASNGPNSVIIASNMLYGVKNEPQLKQRIKAILMTMLLMIVFVFTMFVLGFSNTILKYVMELNVLKNFSHGIYYFLILIKWPIAFVVIFFIVKVLYTMAPDNHISSKYVNEGALFTTIGWMIATFIYSFYVSNFSNYNLFYGGLSNIVVMLMWIYILSYILVVGIVVNASHYNNSVNKNND